MANIHLFSSSKQRVRLFKSVPVGVFLLSLLTYWFTVEPSASFWDCPEYLANAILLEPGHPPGNPFWTLTHRVLSAIPLPFAPTLIINLASGLFTALAVALGSVINLLILRILFPAKNKSGAIINSIVAAGSALIFAWCDSTWFSAVEAEVYAMSLFLTSLTLLLAIRQRLSFDPATRSRFIILIAYICGVSVGVHQLNLLVLPVVFMICGMRRNPRHPFRRLLILFLFGCVAVIIMLKGLLHGTPFVASLFELIAVNDIRLPFNSGLLIWAILTLAVCVAAPLCIRKKHLCALLTVIALIFSGVTLIGDESVTGFCIAIMLSLAAGAAVVRFGNKALTFLWCLPVILVGFSCYSLIIIRSAAHPPMNQGEPSDIFSFIDYLDRKQYGARPLFYGRTPQSRPMVEEKVEITASGDTLYSYNSVARKVRGRKYRRKITDARLSSRTGLLTSADSAVNRSVMAHHGDGYIITDHYYELIYTPELNMFFPRIVEGDEGSMKAYEAWTGMSPETMGEVTVSAAVDSLGKPVRLRHGETDVATRHALRPTYSQHLRMLGGYQLGYMYFRYLLWNFGGRQNDVHTTGEIEHGNFITGIDAIDSLMLGNQSQLPAELKEDNPGRNVFYFIPFLLGIAGIIVLLRSGKNGRRICLLIAVLFMLTGPAIALYLNQNFGEPRERDYSFLGSFFAFSLWITVGLRALAGRRNPVTTIRAVGAAMCAVAVSAMLFFVNLDDHDRSGRRVTEDYAQMILESCPPKSVLFVYGDNFTFPLWYAQDVLGIRRDIIVVSLSYLGSDWYPGQLSSPIRPGGERLRMTGRATDFAYGRYSVVRLATDTVERDAVTALRHLYELPDSMEPALETTCLRLADGRMFDVRRAFGKAPGGFLTAWQLAMIDIIATETAAGKESRHIVWMKNVPSDRFAGLFDETTEGVFTRVLKSGNESDTIAPILPKLRFGGVENGVYVDDTSGKIMSFMRSNLLRHAMRLRDAGQLHRARALTDSLLNGMSFSAFRGLGMQLDDTVVNEEKVFFSFRRDLGTLLADSSLIRESNRALKKAELKEEARRNFIRSLSPSDRLRIKK